MGVLRADVGFDGCDQGELPAAVREYIDGLEELCRDTAERVDRRAADASSASSSTRAPAGRDTLPPGSQRYRIVQHLCSLGLLSDEGQTADEIHATIHIPLNSVSTRMSELIRFGWVTTPGEYQGKTRYAATDKAHAHFGTTAEVSAG